jgi:hypothetical protein
VGHRIPTACAVSISAVYISVKEKYLWNAIIQNITENNMFTEDYVSFEVAKLLKEKGFREPVYHSINKTYRDDSDDASIWTSDRPENHNDIPEEKNHFCTYSCPTIQMAMKWLREVHGYLIVVGNKHGNYVYLIKDLKADTDLGISHDDYTTYEEACEAAIKYCLENLI